MGYDTTSTSPSTQKPELEPSKQTKKHFEPKAGQKVIIKSSRFYGQHNGKSGVIIECKKPRSKSEKGAIVRLEDGEKIYFFNDEFCLPAEASLKDFQQIITETDILMKKLGWSIARGRAYLQKHYGKRSRLYLNDAELIDFAAKLKQLAS